MAYSWTREDPGQVSIFTREGVSVELDLSGGLGVLTMHFDGLVVGGVYVVDVLQDGVKVGESQPVVAPARHTVEMAFRFNPPVSVHRGEAFGTQLWRLEGHVKIPQEYGYVIHADGSTTPLEWPEPE